MKENKDVTILAIESSCDETAAAVVRNGREVLSNVISSQIDLHKLYGGVVPEIASRKHIEKINQVIEETLKEAGKTLDDIDAIGVTYGPGLVGALLVGVAAAKAVAWARKIPLVGVHHIEGHISANSTLCTDSAHGYATLSEELHLNHIRIESGKRKKDIYHIQHINSLHSRLKAFMSDFKGVATKHLQNYLDCCKFLEMFK